MTTEQPPLVDECRKQFEEWAWQQTDWFSKGEPRLAEGELAFRAWQAAWNARTSQLDALVERLEALQPVLTRGLYKEGYHAAISESIAIIRAAGKGEV